MLVSGGLSGAGAGAGSGGAGGGATERGLAALGFARGLRTGTSGIRAPGPASSQLSQSAGSFMRTGMFTNACVVS